MFYLLSVILLLAGCGDSDVKIPRADAGIIDLGDTEIHEGDNIQLVGEWIFVANEFVQPMPADEFLQRYSSKLNVPGPWSARENADAFGGLSSAKGFGTSGLVIDIPSHRDLGRLGILATFVNTAADWSIYSEDVKRRLALMKQGHLATAPESSQPIWIPAFTYWDPGPEERLLLLVHLSNFENARWEYLMPQR